MDKSSLVFIDQLFLTVVQPNLTGADASTYYYPCATCLSHFRNVDLSQVKVEVNVDINQFDKPNHHADQIEHYGKGQTGH